MYSKLEIAEAVIHEDDLDDLYLVEEDFDDPDWVNHWLDVVSA